MNESVTRLAALEAFVADIAKIQTKREMVVGRLSSAIANGEIEDVPQTVEGIENELEKINFSDECDFHEINASICDELISGARALMGIPMPKLEDEMATFGVKI